MKYNYLIIMPRLIDDFNEGYNFPIGIAYISAILKQSGFNVFTVNLNHVEREVGNVVETEILKHDIDVVLTGGLSFQFISLQEIVDKIRFKFPRIKIIVGGGVITGCPEVAMQAFEGKVDIGVIGEGEVTIVELATALENNKRLDVVKGIIYRDSEVNKEGYIITPLRAEIEDLNSLPYPDYDGFGLQDFLERSPLATNNVNSSRTLFMVGSRSCPFQCTFCFHTVGNRYRQRSIEDVLAEIKYLKENYAIKCVKMSDELFGRDVKRIKVFCNQLKKWGLEFTAFFRVDDIDEELVDIIRQSTCISVDLGIESADNNVLKSMRKMITIEQTERALKLLYNAQIKFSGNFIFGDIAETFESATKTLDWWETHKHYNVGLNFICTYPGAYIYKYAVQNGIINDPVQFLKDGCPQINVSKMTNDELSSVARRIFSLVYTAGLNLKNEKVLFTNVNGCVTLQGECPKCGRENIYENINYFAGNNWISCNRCKERYTPILSSDLKLRLFDNVKSLVSKYGEVAFWGITQYTLKLFEEEVFNDKRIIFMDNSYSKQLIKIKGKMVVDPKILKENGVKVVVCCYPKSINYMKSYIYTRLQIADLKVINVLELLIPN